MSRDVDSENEFYFRRFRYKWIWLHFERRAESSIQDITLTLTLIGGELKLLFKVLTPPSYDKDKINKLVAEVFKISDLDNDGRISRFEFEQGVMDSGLESWLLNVSSILERRFHGAPAKERAPRDWPERISRVTVSAVRRVMKAISSTLTPKP